MGNPRSLTYRGHNNGIYAKLSRGTLYLALLLCRLLSSDHRAELCVVKAALRQSTSAKTERILISRRGFGFESLHP